MTSDSQPTAPPATRRRYVPLLVRIVLANAAVLLAAAFAIFANLSHTRISELAADEVLAAALCVVTVANILILRHLTAPLQKLTAFARQLDGAHPGERFPGAHDGSEAGELAQAFNEMLDRLEREQAESGRSVLAAHEGERLRVAQELHDEVGQTLTAVLLQLSRIDGGSEEQRRVRLAEAQDAVRASLEDVRRIATELRPETLADLGLASALTALGESFARRTGIDLTEQIEANLPPLSGETELALYRVAQEALTNVARHSGSQRADLALWNGSGHLTLRVRDYGRGIGEHPARQGNGIRGMRERATAIGGTLDICAPGEGPGSEVTVELPISTVAAR
jgi:two-component system sensor histidine kinase UhpB